jgi:LysR family transcriptional regulator, nitrogen assimilation regulatory protein
MDLKQINYFVHVAELGSFTKAASMLSIAQSALSHQVRQLEVELKQVLLYRTGRGVTPTDAGQRLLSHARGILMQVDRARDEMGELRGTPVGHVVLGLPATLARFLTVPLVKAFRTSFPNASCGIIEALSVPIIDALSAGRVDIGLVFNPMPSPHMEIIPLREQQMYLISSQQSRLSLRAKTVAMKDLPRYPLILPSRPNSNRMRIEARLAYYGLKPTIAFEVDGIASLLDLVHEDYGHTILPLDSLRGHRFAGELVARPIAKPRLTIQLSLVVSATRPMSPLTRGFLELVREKVDEILFVDQKRGPGSSSRLGTRATSSMGTGQSSVAGSGR